MSHSVKKRIGHWLMLALWFLAGTSAGSLGRLLFWHLFDGSGDIEGHEAMLTHATGDKIRRECETNIVVFFREFNPPAFRLDATRFQPNADDRLTVNQIGLWANDRQSRLFVFEQIANPDLDLSQFIAQCHRQNVSRPDLGPYVLTDPSWYSLENVKMLIDNDPQAATKLLACVFRRNHLSHAGREVIAKQLQMTLTARRPSKPSRQANGGSPKTKGADA